MARILIIEDSIYQRSKLAYMLQSDGHEVIQAEDGRQGLAMAATESPDLIFLDLLMPHVGGLEVLQTLQAQQAPCPVVVMTADTQETTRARCQELGARMVLNKPVKNDRLAEALQQILRTPTTPAMQAPDTAPSPQSIVTNATPKEDR